MFSTLYNGTHIQVTHPVHTISVNKHRVAFADQNGQKLASFGNATQAREFVSWLLNIH